ncbi:colanic acid biosynthesis acetyltransferase WcaF [Planctomycetales bacterium ZRK34]|nr:colanic acid biosynthesis acetyltransferase WcaF [Planctomycetales bacterium ZRK34]
MSDKPPVQLARYDNSDYCPGAGRAVRAVWFILNEIIIRCRLNSFSGLRVATLRAFGAKIGDGVVIKPGVSVKYPWNLSIGDHTWIGEGAWLDSLTTINIGANCCISQGAYLCTGNHDWADPAFGLVVKPIVIEDGAWVAAKAVVLPGVTLGDHSILTAGSVASKKTESYGIYRGNPAERVGERTIRG